ncbi:hypothetical protein KGF56_003814 [Candida oxycetoniae]|uniref:ENTH domain-containing protein n=1 Tax=Candida oxycetoniae TaxID=497107 RepID=A0AAI9SUQ6_9ASCO|nr:uncharacterized protein KGF56_003814 [Candida oxycetoniae]KAI3403393.2 hypothetical protein KGF56_003814 [Candida oxycetoniae]
MTTYEKIVKGATKLKVAAPKPKYIEPILMATSNNHSAISNDNFHTIMRTLQQRLRDSAWSVVYKSLIVIHLMIREGERDVTLRYLADSGHSMLNLSQSNITHGSGANADVRFIIKYAKYLATRVKQFDATGIDYVRDERTNNSSSQQGGRLRFLSVEKGLLRESESVQKQIDSLLKNSFVENEINNEIILTAFRLLVNDLLSLFQELNEGVINILEHYFEMSKYDAERSLKIYKKFVDQTKFVIDYLRVAKHLEYITKLHVPTIKHAPTALTSSLEEYLDDPNFEMNRRQYLEEKNNKGNSAETKRPQQKNHVKEMFNDSKTSASKSPSETDNNKGDRHASLIVQQTYNPWNNLYVPIQNQSYIQTSADPFQLQAQQQAQHQVQLQAQQEAQQQAQLQAQQQAQQQAQLQAQQQAQLQAQQQAQQEAQQQAQLQAQQQAQQLQAQQQAQLQAQQQAQLKQTGSHLSALPSIIQGQQYQPSSFQPSYTGYGFGGYSPQPLQPQNTNPFMQNSTQQSLQQTIPLQYTQSQVMDLARSNTNPFSPSKTGPSHLQTSQSQSQSQQIFPQQPLQPQSTNPFVKMATGSQSVGSQSAYSIQQTPQQPLQSQSTNPFSGYFSVNNQFTSFNQNNQQPQKVFDPNTDSLI